MTEKKQQKQGGVLVLLWVPELFLFLVTAAELAALLTVLLDWPERVLWGCILTVAWAGVQAVMLFWAFTGLEREMPVPLGVLVMSLMRSFLSSLLCFACAALVVLREGRNGKLAFGIAAAAMLLNAAGVFVTQRRAGRKRNSV